MAINKLSKDEIVYIKQKYLENISISEIANMTGRDYTTILHLLKKLDIFQYKHPRWTNEEIEYLKENYMTTDWNDILINIPNHNKQNIISKASQLKLKREIYYWNDDDIRILKSGYKDKLSTNEIQKKLNNKFSIEAISTKASKLGLKNKEKWSNEEVNILIDNYSKLDMIDICHLLPNRSRDSIIAYANKLNLKHKTFWSKKELDFLILNHKLMSDEEIGNYLDRTKDAVRGKRFIEKLYHPITPATYNYLSEFIRKRNKKWKLQSARNCSFKCVITGKRFQHIHHLYGMNMILNETLEDLKFTPNVTIKELSDKDLNTILSHFYDVQSKYPLGICLTKEIHKQFHDEYGYGDNTPEQFQEFLNKYNYKIA